jgi:hypothetical protein
VKQGAQFKRTENGQISSEESGTRRKGKGETSAEIC